MEWRVGPDVKPLLKPVEARHPCVHNEKTELKRNRLEFGLPYATISEGEDICAFSWRANH